MAGTRKSNVMKVKVTLEASPYDLAHPKAPAPQRFRRDPRIPDQHLTAFWVNINGVRTGRIYMVEFNDRSGWWYQAQLVVEGKRRPIKVGQAHPRRKLAVEQILNERIGAQTGTVAA